MYVVAKMKHSFTIFEEHCAESPQYIVLCYKRREDKFQRKFML